MKPIASRFRALPILGFLSFFLSSCDLASSEVNIKADNPEKTATDQTISLGGGCYWCVEAVFQQLEGVKSATSGFMGGHVQNPDYEEVVQGTTGHIEVVNVVYDPKVISTEKIIEWFWKSHDPTDPFGQGADKGERYMSHIFYHNEEQKTVSEASKKAAQKDFDRPIVTTIREADEFYEAKVSHQDYYAQNKRQPYCRAVITPKLKKLGLEH